MRLLTTEFRGDRVHMCAYIHVPWCDVINLPHWIRLWCASCHAVQYSMPSGRWVPWDRAQERTGRFQRVCLLRKHTRTSAQLVNNLVLTTATWVLITQLLKREILSQDCLLQLNSQTLTFITYLLHFILSVFLRWWFICPSRCMADFQISSHFSKRGTGS